MKSRPQHLLYKHQVLLLCMLAAVKSAVAIFEEQAGEYDWYQQHVGLPAQAAFSGSGNFLYMASPSAAVASLNTNSGALQWRQLLEESETPTDLVHLHNRKVR